MNYFVLIFFLFLPCVFLGSLYVFGHKAVDVRMTISATPQQVWSIITDSKHYKDWNTVMVVLEGELQEGQTLKYQFQQDDNTSYTIRTTVKKRVENRLLNQKGGTPGVLTFDHRYILEPVPQGTRVVIHEEYRGIGVHFWDPAPVEAAYQRLNLALTGRVLEVFE